MIPLLKQKHLQTPTYLVNVFLKQASNLWSFCTENTQTYRKSHRSNAAEEEKKIQFAKHSKYSITFKHISQSYSEPFHFTALGCSNFSTCSLLRTGKPFPPVCSYCSPGALNEAESLDKTTQTASLCRSPL